MTHEPPTKGPHGMVGEFLSVEDILIAAQKAKDAGYRKMEAYTPFPVHGLADIITPEDHRIKWMIFGGGIAGVIAGYGLQYWTSVHAYAHNTGGKPLHSWPAFIPVTFECMILFAAGAAVFGMLALNGLPRPHHPIFDAENFEHASRDRFFLCIEGEDPNYDSGDTERFLRTLGATTVSEVKQ